MNIKGIFFATLIVLGIPAYCMLVYCWANVAHSLSSKYGILIYASPFILATWLLCHAFSSCK